MTSQEQLCPHGIRDGAANCIACEDPTKLGQCHCDVVGGCPELRFTRAQVISALRARDALHAALESIRGHIAILDCYTSHGARDSGLINADISTAHVQAFRDRVLDRAAASSPVETFGEPVTRPPDGYAWRRHVPTGDGTYLDFQNSGTVNGSEPIESVPYWVGPAAPTEFPKRPSECRHDAAMLKCNECGIDFSRVSVMSAPETPVAHSKSQQKRFDATAKRGKSEK